MRPTAVLLAAAMSASTLVGVTLTGCASSNEASQTTSLAPTTAPSMTQGTDFWYDLARASSVNNDQATFALLSHLDDPAATSDYPARIGHLKSNGMLPQDFDAEPTAKLKRGDLAVALCKALNIKGGVTTRVLGLSPRYATRALVFEGIYPDSTPNQSLTGTEFVGIMGALDDRQRGNPTDVPAEQIPGFQEPALAMDGPPTLDYRLEPLVNTQPAGDAPIYLMVQDVPVPAGATTQGVARKLRVFVTAVQGTQAEFRRSADAKWEKARVGLALDENAEFRTGDKSSIRFNIPPGQTFTLDRLGTCKVSEAAFDGSKVKTTVGLEQGRVRMDVNPTGDASKAVIEKVDFSSAKMVEAGVVHDTQIRSPNSALAVRGTRVSLLDQPPYAPLATSLTGRAEYVNTRRQAVAFGAAGSRAEVKGDQSGAAEATDANSSPNIPPAASSLQFDANQLNRVLQNGGFLRGNVLVGNASIDIQKDFKNVPLAFIVQFGAPDSTTFADLNLAVVAPGSRQGALDYVANGPFTQDLNPSAPGYAKYRADNYPQVSISGGKISRNAVSVPAKYATVGGTQFTRASEAATFPTVQSGSYIVAVTNFIDFVGETNPPGFGTNKIPYRLSVLVNGKLQLIDGASSLGLYETKSYQLPDLTTSSNLASALKRANLPTNTTPSVTAKSPSAGPFRTRPIQPRVTVPAGPTR